jgi:CheY-like chemotaxis protein
MVELMDGAITVSSIYGKGSTFRVRMKQIRATDDKIGEAVVTNLRVFKYSEQRRDRNATLIRAHLPYARVLVVDDVITNLDVATGILKPYGMTVDTVTSGQAAIDLIKKGEPAYNAIFMDHMMPVMDGIEATHIIRDLDSDYAKNIPVIALTANAIVGNDKMFLENGFDDFLSKPIDIMKLDSTVNKWVRDRELERILREQAEAEAENADMHFKRNSVFFFDKDIEGIRFDKALSLFGGDDDTYLDVLRSYVRNTPQLLDKLGEPAQDTLSDYAVVVHGLKSSSRSIGANDISDKALELEIRAKAGDYTSVNEMNEAFISDVRAIVTALSELLSEYAQANPKEKRNAPDENLLTDIRVAAEAYDIDGIDTAMEALELYEYETEEELIEWLREQVNSGQYSSIAKRLSDSI